MHKLVLHAERTIYANAEVSEAVLSLTMHHGLDHFGKKGGIFSGNYSLLTAC
jgi:hypothetical protein